MRLLPNEEELCIVNDSKFVLSNYRIEMRKKDWGESIMISIFLEDISSIQIKYTSIIAFLILGIFCILAGLYRGMYLDKSGEMIGGLIIGVIFFIIWAISRKHVISIFPNGGSPMIIDISGMSDDKISDLMHKVSLAKQTRVNQLYKI
jgi:hypothetical protein